MQMEWAKLWTRPLSLWPGPVALVEQLGKVATAPARRRLNANARRLKSRKKL